MLFTQYFIIILLLTGILPNTKLSFPKIQRKVKIHRCKLRQEKKKNIFVKYRSLAHRITNFKLQCSYKRRSSFLYVISILLCSISLKVKYNSLKCNIKGAFSITFKFTLRIIQNGFCSKHFITF